MPLADLPPVGDTFTGPASEDPIEFEESARIPVNVDLMYEPFHIYTVAANVLTTSF